MKKNILPILLATTIVSGGLILNNAHAENVSLKVHAPSKVEHSLDREEMHHKMAEKMAKKLNLTEEQQQKAEQIREKGKKEIEPLMNEMKDLREKMDEKRRENMEEFEKILTPEQKTKFEDMKKKREEMRHHEGFKDKGSRHFGPHGPRPAEPIQSNE